MFVMRGARSASTVRRNPGRAAGALIAIAALVPAASCTSGSTDSGGANAQAKGPVIRIAAGVDPSYAPLYLAVQRGMFAKAGLNVQLVQTEGGPTASQAVIAGTAQIAANADSTALSLMANNANLRALGVFQSSDRYLKVVLRKGIDGPKQVKTMGSIQGIGLYATHAYLKHNGIDPGSIKIVKGSPPDMPGLLGRGSIDGYILFEPWAANGVKEGGHIAGRIGDFGVGYVQWLLAGQKWLSGHNEVAGKVFKVVAQADRIVTSDPKAAGEATQQQVKLPADTAAQGLPDINFAARGFTGADYASAGKLLDFLLAQKLIKTRPDLETVMIRGWYERYVG
ncbi:ABC transporter substrate-binding protein [Actinomadura montaniterrae]|nr:ABC transporter substrate-binding protein [Actinomadura montaniterrae]